MEDNRVTFHTLVGRLPDARHLRSFFGVRDDACNQDTHVLVVDILVFALWFSLIYPLWVYPVLHGIEAARRTGISPQWMWLGIHPLFGWIAYLVIRSKVPRSEESVSRLTTVRLQWPLWKRGLAMTIAGVVIAVVSLPLYMATLSHYAKGAFAGGILVIPIGIIAVIVGCFRKK